MEPGIVSADQCQTLAAGADGCGHHPPYHHQGHGGRGCHGGFGAEGHDTGKTDLSGQGTAEEIGENMKILIDGDGCPVIDIAISVAKKFNIEVVIMCDTSHIFNKEGAKTMVFSKGADSVDFALINYLEKEDVVITQDYGLAAMAMNKASYVINQNGMIYNDENIDRLLYSRHISKKIRKSGGKTKGPKKRTKEDDINFEKTLNEILELIYFLWKL